MHSLGRSPELTALGRQPRLRELLLHYALRGLYTQLFLRIVLALFLTLTIALEPPQRLSGLCYATAALYGIWVATFTRYAMRASERVLAAAWWGLFLDVAAIAVCTLIASDSDHASWTSDILTTGFFLVPMLASTQLRNDVCALVVAPTVLVFLVSSIAARAANDEPWTSVALRTFVLAGLSVAAVLLCRVQQARVVAIGTIASDRARLASEMVVVEDRERSALAEHLHDGALQYVMSARQDLAMAQQGDPIAFDRVEQALRETSGLLRDVTRELHPAVLEQVGLGPAISTLTQAAGDRHGLKTHVDVSAWPRRRTEGDRILYATARELVSNVAKHARATFVSVSLRLDAGRATLVVRDDGIGINEGSARACVEDGHIGLASRRTRLAAAGGELTLDGSTSHGTTATAVLPLA